MKERHSRLFYHWLSLIIGLCASQFSYAQSQIKVVDENGDPLIGVYVSYQNKTDVTDIDGLWHFDSQLDENTSILFSFIGYKDLRLNLSEIYFGSGQVTMYPDNELLNEVVIVGRTNARIIDLPYSVSHIKSKEILNSSYQNSADILNLSGGAYIQKSQMGGGSPVLRGFESNKVLLVVDGVRLNNAIYRNGHLQNAITIDPNILQQAEIIFGPGSLMYGSEALGGVIHYKTKSPLLNWNEEKKAINKLSAQLRYNSANNEKKIHLDYTYGTKSFGVLTSVTYSDFEDLRMGSSRNSAYPEFGLRREYVLTSQNGEDIIIQNPNPNIQVGTAYNQLDLLQKYSYRISSQLLTELNLQYSTSSDIPRYDNLSEYRNGSLRFAEWNYGPQNRLLISPKISLSKRTRFFDKAYLIGSFQKIDEDRISRRLNNPLRETQQEDVKVWGATLDFHKRINPNQKITYGLDLHYNDVQSNSEGFNISSQLNENILTRYPSGGSQLLNSGIYAQHNLQNRDSSLVWIAGLRFTAQKVNFIYDRNDPIAWPEYFYNNIENSSHALVGITGINYQKKNWYAKASIGSAFRAPNVDDLAKVRINNDEITIPNPKLKSERVLNNELSFGWSSNKLKFNVTGYLSILKDAIVREAFTLPNGSPTYTTSGDTLLVTANTNANSGDIRGLSLSMEYNVMDQLSFSSTINFQKGISTDQFNIDSPLGHIPPTFGFNKIKYKAEKIEISLEHQFNGWKRIENFGGSVDNPELATLDGSPEWHIINVNMIYQWRQSWTLQFGLNNLSDIHYRPFASGLSGPGRHISIGIRYN